MNMYIIKIYRENTIESFTAIPVFAKTEEEAKKEALKIDKGTKKVIKIEVTK